MSAKTRRHVSAKSARTEPERTIQQTEEQPDGILELLVNAENVSSENLQKLLLSVESYDVLAKVFLLEGTPYVFQQSPMKYLIFREQVADRFCVGYQDVCIVGSAKLGFSPAPKKFGRTFAQESDVDVVIISEEMFHKGSKALFSYLNLVGPPLTKFGFVDSDVKASGLTSRNWREVKEGIRNYVYQNFNPGLLPETDPLKQEIFAKIRSTSPLFMALEPKVLVSKIRCRFFRDWRAAEDYYTNTLRQLAHTLKGEDHGDVTDLESEDIDD